MNARHTPGPWTTSKIGNNYDQYMVYAEGAPNGRNVASSIDGEANARLIAAAPVMMGALYAACDQLEQCERMFPDDAEFKAALTAVREAIAVATR